jgi:propanediol utilization protein
MKLRIKTEISARHLHLCQKDLDRLFGPSHRLKVRNKLSQTGEFAAEETVSLYNKHFRLENVRIIGPIRKASQVEITLTEARRFKINPSVNVSGDLKGAASIGVKGPKDRFVLKKAVIVAMRHIHASPAEARRYRLKNGQLISVRVGGRRGLTFENVIVRVRPNFRLSFQIDTDEANAAGLLGGEWGEVII